MLDFKLDDVVSFGGEIGKVVKDNREDITYPIEVRFNNYELSNQYFTLYGKFNIFHKEPLLKLISRAKTKVTKYKVLYKDCGHLELSSHYYTNELDFYERNEEYDFELMELLKSTAKEFEE